MEPTSTPRIPDGFTEQRLRAGDVSLNYVRGGSGPTLVLLHGYPQTWYTWRDVLTTFAEQYTVIAPDLRGAGGSDAPSTGYGKKQMAADLRSLLTQLDLHEGIRIVGHDIGAMVGYTYSAQHPDEVERLVFCEAVVPDDAIYNIPVLTQDGNVRWSFGLFQVPDFPESLVTGRELGWVRGYMSALAITPSSLKEESMAEYARGLAADDAHLRASFEPFRALMRDTADMAVLKQTKLQMPVLAIGAANSIGASVGNQLTQYADDVQSVVIDDAGHYLFDEQPDEMLNLVLPFLR